MFIQCWDISILVSSFRFAASCQSVNDARLTAHALPATPQFLRTERSLCLDCIDLKSVQSMESQPKMNFPPYPNSVYSTDTSSTLRTHSVAHSHQDDFVQINEINSQDFFVLVFSKENQFRKMMPWDSVLVFALLGSPGMVILSITSIPLSTAYRSSPISSIAAGLRNCTFYLFTRPAIKLPGRLTGDSSG